MKHLPQMEGEIDMVYISKKIRNMTPKQLVKKGLKKEYRHQTIKLVYDRTHKSDKPKDKQFMKEYILEIKKLRTKQTPIEWKNQWFHFRHKQERIPTINFYPSAILNKLPKRVQQVILDYKLFDIQGIEQPKSSFIFGNSGTGKTVIACQLLLKQEKYLYCHPRFVKYDDGIFHQIGSIHYAIPNRTVAFIRFDDLINEMEDNREKRKQDTSIERTLDKYSKIGFLVIDDFIISKTTDARKDFLSALINRRNDNDISIGGELITIITSNLTLDEMKDEFKDDRIIRRIFEMCGDEIIKLQHWKKRQKSKK